MRLFERTFTRLEIPIKYSKGYNPRAKISIASPLSLGMESEEEWMDIELLEKIDKEDFLKKANLILPNDIRLLKAEYIDENTPISRLINWCVYEIRFIFLEEIDEKELKEILNKWLNKEDIWIERYRKKGRQKVVVTESISGLFKDVHIEKADKAWIILKGTFKIGESGTLRPRDFMDAFIMDNNFKVDTDSISFKRIAQKI